MSRLTGIDLWRIAFCGQDDILAWFILAFGWRWTLSCGKLFVNGKLDGSLQRRVGPLHPGLWP